MKYNLLQVFVGLFSLNLWFSLSATEPINDEALMNDLRGTDGMKAFVELISAGKPGWEILSNAYVEKGMSLKTLLAWEFHLRTNSGGSYDEALDGFQAYIFNKCVKNGEFSEQLTVKFNDESSSDTLLAMLSESQAGARQVGYLSLKKRYPKLPDFEFMSSSELRASQIVRIQRFLNSAP